MLHLLILLAIYVVIAVIEVTYDPFKIVKSDKGLMILGGSIIIAVVITSMTLVGWGIWALMQAQL